MIGVPLKTAKEIRIEFEKRMEGYSFVYKDISDFNSIYIIEDSHVIFVGILETDLEDKKNLYTLYIEELTYNELGWKYNNTQFIRDIQEVTHLPISVLTIQYSKFNGFDRPYWNKEEMTFLESVDSEYPELKLKDRYAKWPGKHYYYIVFDFDDINGNVYHAVSYTMSSPTSHVNKLGKKYIKRGIFCNDTVRRGYNYDFEDAIKSWKGIKRQTRLEDHLRYCIVENDIKEYDETWRYADRLLELANQGAFDNVEKSSYLRPVNKWVTEEYVFKLTKQLFKNYHVIYQHRPFYLRSAKGGQMSYDIFIAGLNVAIEYQGKQHFEPVDFFGGEESFVDVQKRDKEKAELSKANGIKLVYINYWETVTPELIREKVGVSVN